MKTNRRTQQSITENNNANENKKMLVVRNRITATCLVPFGTTMPKRSGTFMQICS